MGFKEEREVEDFGKGKTPLQEIFDKKRDARLQGATETEITAITSGTASKQQVNELEVK